MAAEEKLSTRTRLLYGVGDVGNAVVNSAVQFFLMIFYTDGALIGPALAANALLVGKVWDAINDPLFGWLSDRTTSRFGKRRVFMIFGAVVMLLLLIFVALFLLPWKILSDRWNKGPAYALGLAMGGLAVGSAFFAARTDPVGVCHCRGGGHWLFGPVGLSLGDGARRSRV